MNELELCIWKIILEYQKGTTYIGVKQSLEQGYETPLKKCLECNGLTEECKQYHLLKKP